MSDWVCKDWRKKKVESAIKVKCLFVCVLFGYLNGAAEGNVSLGMITIHLRSMVFPTASVRCRQGEQIHS